MQKFVIANFNKNNTADYGVWRIVVASSAVSTNGCHHFFHEIYDHQDWKVGTSRGAESFETIQAAIIDVVALI